MTTKIILSNKEAVKDLRVLNNLILDIIKHDAIKDGGYNFPCYADSEKERMSGLDMLMNKYSYGWYFTVDTQNKRLYTQQEQVENVVQFQQWILDNIGEDVIYVD